MTIRRFLVALSVVALTLSSQIGAAAAPVASRVDTTVAVWRMNEPRGASVMHDASGNGLDGSIGSLVVTGATHGRETGYRFPWTRPNTPPARPQRLVQVPDHALLDPGRHAYAVTVRYRTENRFGNILQKGQARSVGGFWKFQAPRGIVRCLFRGSEGQATAGSGRRLNDGRWHTVRCERTATRVVMTVDGKVTGVKNKRTGSISNAKPLTIGGKLECDQVKVTCDYFAGDIDFVRIEVG